MNTSTAASALGVEHPVGSVMNALELDGLHKVFNLGRRGPLGGRQRLTAVDQVSLHVPAKQTLGIVGESGSGKSTLGRMIARLIPIDGGTILFDGQDITNWRGSRLRGLRRNIQMVFQDPYGSLDPTKRISHAIGEPLIVHRLARRRDITERAEELAQRVALDPKLVHRYPDQLSGGQRQRVVIGRALSLNPQLIIADEPTSALDLSTRSEILNLLLELQLSEGLTIVLISHDFTTVRHLSHQIAVMYLGKVVEYGPASHIAEDPRHPYTEALLSAVPIPSPQVQRTRKRIVLSGSIPSPVDPPSGCPFHTRCPIAVDQCARVAPEMKVLSDGRSVACHLATE